MSPQSIYFHFLSLLLWFIFFLLQHTVNRVFFFNLTFSFYHQFDPVLHRLSTIQVMYISIHSMLDFVLEILRHTSPSFWPLVEGRNVYNYNMGKGNKEKNRQLRTVLETSGESGRISEEGRQHRKNLRSTEIIDEAYYILSLCLMHMKQVLNKLF